MTNAEHIELCKKHLSDHIVTLYGYDIKKICKAYLKHRIESITDEEIENESNLRYGEVVGGIFIAERPQLRSTFKKGAKWLKNKLINK